jgi:hypothetical protein
MTAPDPFADSQIPLAPRAPSIHDPTEDIGRQICCDAQRGFSWDSVVGCDRRLRRAHMRRREVITLLGGAAAWPLATRAQQPAKLPTIGVLGASASAWSKWVPAFVQRLRQLGWIEGRTVAIEYRWS